jgi:PAS domain S-box-containing protein
MVELPGITIQDKIYESTNSLVYRGIQADGLAVVIKMLKQNYPSPQELTRYRREYEITRSLNLAGVIKAYNQQDYQRTLIILLEDFGGKSLEQWMRSHPASFDPMPLSTFLQLAIELVNILGKIHAAHVIHKDINPGNIVFNPDTGVVKIIDFGIATQFSRTNPTFKSPHVLEGTLAYLSPEQTGRMNRLLDYRTDFYSLGVTFYELLTGYLPFPTTDMLELVHCHIAQQPVPLHEMNAAIPKPVSDIVLKLMAKNAADRYQNAWGIKADLESCARQFSENGQIAPMQLGLQDILDQFQIPQKLYGREAEIKTLIATFDRIARIKNVGEACRPKDEIPTSSQLKAEMMLVSGYAGIGKSALVQELHKPITAERGYFISGKFDQFQRNIPYSAITDALQKLVQQLLGESANEVKQWRSQLLTALKSNGQIISDVIPDIELIIGQQQPVPEVGATEAQNRFNRVFQQFIRVFCSEEHPLVIFLDDLQWADSATLNLIELMMTDTDTQHLLIIGAYRDNEMNASHPLMMTLEKLRKDGATLSQITLSPLALGAIAQLIADTLHSDLRNVRPLAKLVLRKTDGNPFFVNEFLKTLYAENLLNFDVEYLKWRWDAAQIESANITDNVVDLMLGNLKKLPTSTQQILQLAACVGADFDLSTLSIICESTPHEIFPDLVSAVQAGLIMPISELDEQLLVQYYQFLHDRVQQAAYELIDAPQKRIVHLKIGRSLLAKRLLEPHSERLFEIADHLNHGVALVTHPDERDEIARLNLIAAQKAKTAIAHGVAKKYLAAGRAWQTESSWRTHYDLTLALYSETTEVAFLCGDFEEVESWAAIVLQDAKTVLDTVNAYEVKIQTDIAQNRPLRAINTALQVLQKLGIHFPEMPSQLDIQHELDTIISLLSEQQIEDLIRLPEMTDPEKLAAMRILSRITIVAYIAVPELMLLLVFKQVQLSIQHGNAYVSAFAYATYGLFLCGLVGDIETGYQFGKVALSLLSQPNTYSLKARIVFTVYGFIIHWKEHARELLQPYLEAYQSGLETGDLEYAGYCAYVYCLHSFIVGKELVGVEREIVLYGEAMHQIKQEISLPWLRLLQQSVFNLMHSSVNPSHLMGKFYNEENRLPQHEAINDETAIFYVYFNKLLLGYLFSEYAQAVENADFAERYVLRVAGTALVPVYYFYDSLARLAMYLESEVLVQEEILQKVATSQEKMKQWARHSPMNYLHKFLLVQAEMARVSSQLLEAEEFYEQAIQGARENDYLQEEALAYELAAKFYLARSREKIAQTYMKEAHYCYERWGANAKVKELETRYSQFFPQSSDVGYTSIRKVSKTTSNSSPIAFDLAAVLKASQAISSEIELDQLLHTLMQILIENAGAQTGFLILKSVEEWVIEASCDLNEGEAVCTSQVLQSLPTTRLPESIIQYVIRTRKSILLNDATREGDFINEPYIQQNSTQSIFCLPLINQSKLVGVLYLENRLAAGAFTPERSQVLSLLSTQAAIAIENAKLYSKLREGESQMTQFLEAIPVGVAVVDAAGRPYYLNQQARQLSGKGIDPLVSAEQIAEAYQVYLSGTNQPYPMEKMPIIRALKGERTRVDDVEIHQDRATIPVESSGTPIFDEQGKIVYAISIFQDITKRKQAESSLRESEARYRLLFENNPNPMWIYDAQTLKFLIANDSAIQYYGYSLDEFLTMTILEIRPSADIIRLQAHMNHVKDLPYTHSGEWQHCKKDGTVIDVEITSRAITWSGVAARCVLLKDITERKQAEQLLADYSQNLAQQVAERTLELEREKEALRQSEATNRAIVSAIPDLLIQMSQDGIYLKVVRSGNFQPFNSQQLKVGANIREVLPPSIAHTRMVYTQQAIQTGELQVYEQKIVGEDQVYEQEVRIVKSGDSEVLVMIRDIRDRKQAEEASILEERNRMAREIHDTLAQSFTSIIVHLDAAAQRITLDPNTAQSHLKTGRALARSGLADARRSVEALRPQILEEGDLQNALDRFAVQIFSDTSVQIVCEVFGEPYDLPNEIEANLLRIGQEALTNSFKYANASEVRVELRYENAQYSLRIKDNGQGFESKNLSIGRGFGLLGMTERAERIGAELTIVSNLGQGTEITVRIPTL